MITRDRREKALIYWKTEVLNNLVSDFLLFLPEGKLDRTAVLKAICAGFQETTEPSICLSGGSM